MSGYLIFDIGGHELAAPLAEVREVIRVDRLDTLPGLEPPVTGLMQLRGSPLPVCDLRALADPNRPGDVVLLSMADGSLLGVAVDSVVAVVAQDALVADGDERGVDIGAYAVPMGLPSYVVGVMHRVERPEDAVFLVAMSRLVDSLVRV